MNDAALLTKVFPVAYRKNVFALKKTGKSRKSVTAAVADKQQLAIANICRVIIIPDPDGMIVHFFVSHDFLKHPSKRIFAKYSYYERLVFRIKGRRRPFHEFGEIEYENGL